MDDRSEITNKVAEIQYSLLGVEILTEAFLALKENPDLTVQQALEIGIKEWDV